MKYIWCEKETRRMASGICEARRCTCDNYEQIRREEMKQIRLTKLELTNFKGVKEFTLEPDGQNLEIRGANATGKTSLYDGFLWLLFGKDSLNSATFEIKTIGASGPLHNLSHEVEGVFDLDGRTLTLRKTYAEKYTKKRGNARPEFTGHEINHFIGGVPVKKSEYDQQIKDIIDEEAFRLLTNPRQFNEVLHWTKRREILMQICGDIADHDVIKSDKALANLPKILAGRYMDDHIKMVKARMSEINKELEKLPVRIDEATKSIADLSGVDVTTIEADLSKLKAMKSEKEAELLTLSAGGRVAELTKQIREIEGEIQADVNTQREKIRARIQEEQKKADAIIADIRSKRIMLENITIDKNAAAGRIENLEAHKEILRRKWMDENARKLSFEMDGTCPTCGQQIPPEQLEAAYREAQAKFNAEKAQILTGINAQGKAAKEEIERLQAEFDRMTEARGSLLLETETLQTQLKDLDTKINQIATEPIQAPGELVARLNSLKEEIRAIDTGDTQAAKDKLIADIQAIDAQINDNLKHISTLEAAEKTLHRIDELEAHEKALATEYEAIQSELYTCELFTRAKVAMLEDRINARFKMARFKLFADQINGGLTECCEVTFNGVPYSSLNNAARLQIGLDVINTLSAHYGVSCPIVMDNRESVTWIPDVDAQVISLVVDESAKELTVNINQKTAAKAA